MITGCGGNASCTLQELFVPGASITVDFGDPGDPGANSVVFDSFIEIMDSEMGMPPPDSKMIVVTGVAGPQPKGRAERSIWATSSRRTSA